MAGRDEGALRELYDRHALWISARLARRCADPDAVCDVLQDTFFAAWDGAAASAADIQAAELGLELAATSLHPVRGVANTIRCRSAWKPGCPDPRTGVGPGSQDIATASRA